VSGGALLAAGAAGCGVLAAWEGILALEAARPGARLARLLRPALSAGRGGRPVTSPERRRLVTLAALSLVAGGWLVAGPVVGLLAAAAGPAAAGALLRVRARRWRAEAVAGAPAIARSMADALAGGHSVRGAVAEAARAGGVEGAAGNELRRAAASLALGEHTDAALDALARRVADPAFDTIVAAVLLQREAGGDLAGLLRTVATSLEAGARVRAEARSATAQARFTALVVALLPAGAAGLAELAQPGYLASLIAEPLPAALAGGALCLEILALVLVQRLARVPA